MPRVKQSILKARLLQKRGILIRKEDLPLPSRVQWRAKVRNPKLKTPAMLIKEIEFNKDIEDILVSGPLRCTPPRGVRVHRGQRCGRCIQCKYGINYSTASKWRARLGIPPFTQEVAS